MPDHCQHLRVSIALAAGLLLACSESQGQATAPDAEAMRARIEAPRTPGATGLAGLPLSEVLRSANVPGISVAVVHDFQLHWTRGYGVAEAGSARAVDTLTLFQAASISKPVTAMAAMRLVQAGRISLDADVNSYLRSWQVPASSHTANAPVTLRSLFSHTSGADDGFGFPGYKPGAPMPSPVQIIRGEAPSNVRAVTFAREPFRAQKYSGGGTTVVQLALMDVTGRPFGDWMRESLLDPLGMTASTFDQPLSARDAARAAHAHDGRGRTRDAPWHVYPELAAAGLWTTAGDLARFVLAVQLAARGDTGGVITPASAREMITPVGVGPFAVGLLPAQMGEGWYISHGGSNWGFRGNFWGHVRKGYGVVVLTNGDGGGAVINEIRDRVAAAYGWDSTFEPLRR
jgi:CubicO group peptidase (beta-lactamase class C family)